MAENDENEVMTAEDVEQAYYDQLAEGWENTYVNPVNTATERARLDELGL